MSTTAMLRVFFAIVFTLLLTGALFYRSLHDPDEDTDKPRYLPLFPSLLLPGVLVSLSVLFLWRTGPEKTADAMLSICFPIFLQICLYQLVLLLLLPLLRRWFRAGTCAALWLLPNYLYLTQQAPLQSAAPKWVWQLPQSVVSIALAVWLSGMLAVLLWHIGRHLVFRHKLLQNSYYVKDPAIRQLWLQAQQDARVKKTEYPLMISPVISTPLSIGMFRKSVRVILPERQYTPEELTLIFRHELVHIGQEDASAKFFLVFCTAMCWFNPLMWIARARSAEDLELSCDETVLRNCDEATRRRYAELLLRTAGAPQGFTTCLSASAESLRHRLQHVIRPKKRLTGTLLLGLCFLLLILTTGQVALAYEVGSGETLIFENESHNYYSVNSISWRDDGSYTMYDCADEAAMLDFFSDLRLSKMTGLYDWDGEPRVITMIQGPDGVIGLNLQEQTLRVTWLYREQEAIDYYLAEPVDPELLRQWVKPREPEPAYIAPPELMLYFNEDVNPGGVLMYAQKQVSAKIEDGVVVSSEVPPPEGSIGGVYGQMPEHVELIFSIEPEDDFTVTITPLDGSGETVVSGSELENFFLLPLRDCDARYTVHANFEPTEDLRFEMIYRFEVCGESDMPSEQGS